MHIYKSITTITLASYYAVWNPCTIPFFSKTPPSGFFCRDIAILTIGKPYIWIIICTINPFEYPFVGKPIITINQNNNFIVLT